MAEFLQRLSSRKLWGSLIVTGTMLYNAWGIAQRPLEWIEIVAIASAWGVFITIEGIADAKERGGL